MVRAAHARARKCVCSRARHRLFPAPAARRTRSLRTAGSWPLGIAAGAAYAYMVATWGGFIFVGNLVAVHAAALAALGYYSPQLWASFALFFAVGTAGAVNVPVVNWGPVRSLEQIGPLLVLLGLTYIAACEFVGKRRGLTWDKDFVAMVTIRVQVRAAACARGRRGAAHPRVCV